ncbi:efflux RND transporter periplasmic adaptor subunit [sulfur-oxidizing endosymbiont of Gigantopelta aegis]|uniref:efflux RND transporter periplasmic adaptor subunit n=1 Tax=sulfur-oxidizing endosymbiont of Gigantopelta aegis TaxID=2794934 RepID=UPI0018DE1B19|nr:efflux RND transporter periplasmic adaptor subunit [sulfur-oxidizing endosymbiont of Gigantopelta aegis]
MNKQIILTALIMSGIGVGVGYWFAPSQSVAVTSGNTQAQPEKRKPLFYRNAMNPSVTSPIPSKDAMGMDYVPVYADSAADSKVPGLVKIDPVIVQNMGVRTSIAKLSTLSHTIRTVGRVDYDEQRMARLHPKTEGWIEELYIDTTGERVEKGSILLSVYSPKLVSTEQEYLLALSSYHTLKNSPIDDIRRGAKSLLKSSRERLTLLDVPDHQIRELEKTRKIKRNLHIHTSVSGTVIKIGARKGQYVTPQTELYMIADLEKVWVYANIYEYELPWVKEGDEVSMTLTGIPGKTFRGKVSYIYPYAEAKTRTIQVRAQFDNSERLLKPEMYADITIKSSQSVEAIIVPSEAIIRSGNNAQVFVVHGSGKFEPHNVTLGIESNGQVAILDGIKANDRVVTSGQFLIDSESKLREATAKMISASKTKPMDMEMPKKSAPSKANNTEVNKGMNRD